MAEPAVGVRNWRQAPAAQSALAALVVFALGIGLVAFNVIDISGGYAVETRFVDLFAAMVVAFLGRITVIYLRRGRPRAALAIAGPFALYLGARRLSVDFTQLMDGLAEAVVRGIGVPGRAVPFASEVVTWAVLIGCAIVMLAAARQLLAGSFEGSHLARAAATARTAARPAVPYMFLGLVAVAVLFPFAPIVDRRVLDVAILVLTYVMLGWGLNIVVGLAGLLDLGYVAFYAVGAYSFALLAHFFGFGFWICLPFAGIMSALAGVLLGFPVLRLRGDYLAIVTLGFGEMVRIILLNWTKLTNGPDGISGIPRPTFFGLPFRASVADGGITFHEYFGLKYAPLDKFIFLYYVILVLALITNGFTLRIRKLPVGRAWEALREDETACRSLGINPHNTKLTAFGIGAMFGGLAGSFFATRQAFISPESFTFIESAVILAIVVLGGMGSQLGVVIAAVVLIGVPEFFRDLAEFRMLAFGAGMVLIMIWRPLGLLSHREPTLRLHPKTRP